MTYRNVGFLTVMVVALALAVAPARLFAQAAAPPPPTSAQQTADAGPAEIRYKGVTFVPGGFIEAAVIYRSANENADMGSTFINVPYEGSANSHLSEFRGSARQSRLSLLVAGKTGAMRMSGYYEFDFLGASPTSNEVESNSFNIRQRQLFKRSTCTLVAPKGGAPVCLSRCSCECVWYSGTASTRETLANLSKNRPFMRVLGSTSSDIVQCGEPAYVHSRAVSDEWLAPALAVSLGSRITDPPTES